MNNEIVNSLYTIAGATALYVIKEIGRYFTNNQLNRKKLNLETIYPIYVDCFKKAKMMVGSYIIPTEPNEFLDAFDPEVYESLQETHKETYESVLPYRQYLNLYNRVQKMKDFKYEFRTEFSVNQIFFNKEFVVKTIEIIQEFDSDLSYLNNCLENMVERKENVDINNIVTKAYKDKIMQYELYLEAFEKEFKAKFKI